MKTSFTIKDPRSPRLKISTLEETLNFFVILKEDAEGESYLLKDPRKSTLEISILEEAPDFIFIIIKEAASHSTQVSIYDLT